MIHILRTDLGMRRDVWVYVVNKDNRKLYTFYNILTVPVVVTERRPHVVYHGQGMGSTSARQAESPGFDSRELPALVNPPTLTITTR